MLKLVAVMLLRYDVRLTDSEGGWKMRNSWVITQTGLQVNITGRK